MTCTNLNNSNHIPRTTWAPVLEKIANNLYFFDYDDYQSELYKESVFMKLLNDKNIDIIFYVVKEDDFRFNIWRKIKQNYPEVKIISFFSDDDWRFNNYDRFIALYSDYFITTYPSSYKKYRKYGHKNVILSQWACNQKMFKPLDLEKKYDVTFIGSAYEPRIEWIRYLKDNGVKVKIFGEGWNKYDKLKGIYGGFLSSDDFIKVINQSKINLSFTWSSRNDGKLQFKARNFEFAGCNSFQLTNYDERLFRYYKHNEEIVTFNSKKNLIKKINYYLKNDKEREEIAKRAYERTIKEHTWEQRFRSIFKEVNSKDNNTNFNFNKNSKYNILIVNISKQNNDEIKRKLNNQFNIKHIEVCKVNQLNIDKLKKGKYEFVTFMENDENWFGEKLEFQAYSLDKDKTDICISDFYLNKNFQRRMMVNRILVDDKLDSMTYFLSFSTIMFSKNFFISNMNQIIDSIDNRYLLKKILKHNKVSRIEIPLFEANNISFRKYSFNIFYNYYKYSSFNFNSVLEKLKNENKYLLFAKLKILKLGKQIIEKLNYISKRMN